MASLFRACLLLWGVWCQHQQMHHCPSLLPHSWTLACFTKDKNPDQMPGWSKPSCCTDVQGQRAFWFCLFLKQTSSSSAACEALSQPVPPRERTNLLPILYGNPSARDVFEALHMELFFMVWELSVGKTMWVKQLLQPSQLSIKLETMFSKDNLMVNSTLLPFSQAEFLWRGCQRSSRISNMNSALLLAFRFLPFSWCAQLELQVNCTRSFLQPFWWKIGTSLIFSVHLKLKHIVLPPFSCCKAFWK